MSGAELVAVVSGAGSGLGRSVAHRLSAGGYHVMCLDVDGAAASTTATESRGAATAVQCDVTDEASVTRAVQLVAERGAAVDVLVNAAGVASVAHTIDVPLAEWQRILDVNLTGTFLLTQRLLPMLLERGGAVVNVASVAAVRGWRYMAAYAASKGGVIALSKSLAVEYGRRGVRVNCICPGGIDTPLARNLDRPHDADPELLARGRPLVDPPVASPNEIADAIVFLASPAARFIVGAELIIDGGVVV